MSQFYGVREVKKDTGGGERCEKTRWREQDVQIGRRTQRHEGWERERCMKGHERDSDMPDICKYTRLCPLMDRWDILITWVSLTFSNKSIPIFHRAGNFSGRQRAGRTLGPLQRGRGVDEERRMVREKGGENYLHRYYYPKYFVIHSKLNTTRWNSPF